MHPPLEVHQHPACKEYILALKQCHADHPIAKYWGVCTDTAKALNLCFKGEKVAKRAQNKERLRLEQERLRARFDSRRKAEAEAKGEAPPPPTKPTRLPGYWIPEQRGIPKEQPQQHPPPWTAAGQTARQTCRNRASTASRWQQPGMEADGCGADTSARPDPQQQQQRGQGAGEPAAAQQQAQQHRRPHVLLAATGSVATIKLAQLAEHMLQFADVKVIATKAATYFVQEQDLPAACRPLLGDEDEWRQWRAVGDPVVHIELRRWADAFLIAPLSANTLAKVANGLCDNLVTCVFRAWDFSKPLLLAPAMNTFMWDSPFTARHLAACRDLGALVVPPVTKKLACGDVGSGAMAAPEDIAAACCWQLAAAGCMHG